jgi:hypothetical protein
MIRSRPLIAASGTAVAVLLALRLAAAPAFAGVSPGPAPAPTGPRSVAPMDIMCLEIPAGNPPPCKVPVVLSSPGPAPVFVRISTQDQTAHAPVDYLPIRDQVLEIPPGSSSATVAVRLTPRQIPIGSDLTFQLIVFDPSPGLVVGPPATVTISPTGN